MRSGLKSAIIWGKGIFEGLVVGFDGDLHCGVGGGVDGGLHFGHGVLEDGGVAAGDAEDAQGRGGAGRRLLLRSGFCQ